MKLGRIGVVVVSLLLSGQSYTLQAAEPEPDQGVKPMGDMRAVVESSSPTKDWGVALGLKTWFNEWDLPVPIGVRNQAGTGSTTFVQSFQSDNELSYIPAFTARYRNFIIGGSFMPSTDYKFQPQSTQSVAVYWGNNSQLVDAGERVIEVKGEREEWDLNVGYLFTPNLAITLGYKSIEREYDYTIVTSPYTYTAITTTQYSHRSHSSHAPIIGLAASLPVGNNFNFYGTLAYGIVGGDADGNYYLGELGVDYTLPLDGFVSGVSFSAGYRFQRMDMDSMMDDSSMPDMSDTTSGFTLGVRALF